MENLEDKLHLSKECIDYVYIIKSVELLKQVTKYLKYGFGIAAPVPLLLKEYPTAALLGGFALLCTYLNSNFIINEKIAKEYLEERRHNKLIDILKER